MRPMLKCKSLKQERKSKSLHLRSLLCFTLQCCHLVLGEPPRSLDELAQCLLKGGLADECISGQVARSYYDPRNLGRSDGIGGFVMDEIPISILDPNYRGPQTRRVVGIIDERPLVMDHEKIHCEGMGPKPTFCRTQAELIAEELRVHRLQLRPKYIEHMIKGGYATPDEFRLLNSNYYGYEGLETLEKDRSKFNRGLRFGPCPKGIGGSDGGVFCKRGIATSLPGGVIGFTMLEWGYQVEEGLMDPIPPWITKPLSWIGTITSWPFKKFWESMLGIDYEQEGIVTLGEAFGGMIAGAYGRSRNRMRGSCYYYNDVPPRYLPLPARVPRRNYEDPQPSVF